MRQEEINSIIKIVCEATGRSFEELQSRDRTAWTAQSRFILMRFLHELLGNLSEVGQLLGGRTHATVTNGLIQYSNMMETSPLFRKTVGQIEESMKSDDNVMIT